MIRQFGTRVGMAEYFQGNHVPQGIAVRSTAGCMDRSLVRLEKNLKNNQGLWSFISQVILKADIKSGFELRIPDAKVATMSTRFEWVPTPTPVSLCGTERMLDSSSRCEVAGPSRSTLYVDAHHSSDRAHSSAIQERNAAEARVDVMGAVVGSMGLVATLGLMTWLAIDQLCLGASSIQIGEMVQLFK